MTRSHIVVAQITGLVQVLALRMRGNDRLLRLAVLPFGAAIK